MKIYLRPAIAMIELIFAIVVMGIVMMSAPTLIGVASQTGSMSSYQESITEASTMVKLITTRYWDESDINNSSPIVSIAATGYPGAVSRTIINSNTGAPVFPTAIGPDIAGVFNDMDDFNGRMINMTIPMALEVGVVGETDYIDVLVQLTAQVQYGRAGIPGAEPFSPVLGGLAAVNARDTKVITVSLTSPRFNDKNISLSTFSCNIGAYTLRDLGVNR